MWGLAKIEINPVGIGLTWTEDIRRRSVGRLTDTPIGPICCGANYFIHCVVHWAALSVSANGGVQLTLVPAWFSAFL
jgi:hypothetical protein